MISTGETTPAGESTVARLLPVSLIREQLNMAKLSSAQSNAEAYPHAMSAYLHHLRPQMPGLKEALKRRHAELRERFRKASTGAHLRSPSALAHVALGLEMLWPFALSVGALTPAQARDHQEKSLAVLDCLGQRGSEIAVETDPAQRFLSRLRSLLTQGTLLVETDLKKPLGQRREKDALIGEPVGWLGDDEYYFLAEPTYSAVVDQMKSESMSLTERALWRRLAEQKLIEPGDREDRLTQRKELGERRITVIVMKKKTLFEDDGPTGGGGGGGGGGAGRGGGGGGGAGGGGGGASTGAGSASTADAGSDCPDFSDGLVTNRTTEAPDRTSPEANRTSATREGAGRRAPEHRGTAALSPDAAVLSGPVGTVGTDRKEEKSREGDSSPVDPEQSASRAPLTIPPGTGPTVPTGPVPVTLGNGGGSSRASGADPEGGPYQLDQRHWTIVADGLGYFHQNPQAEAPVFCIKTARRLLGHKHVGGATDYHRRAELQRELDAAGLAGAAELEFNLLPVVAEMERAGVGVDVGAWADLVTAAAADLTKRRGLLAEMGLVTLEVDAQVRVAVEARGVSVGSTSWKALAPFTADPLVSEVVAYRRTAGFLNSVGRAVLEAARRGGGRVHANFDPLAAPTGRMSCSKPNLMSIPKAPEYRRCFVPAPGHLFVVADYAAIELRVLADVTRDEALTKVFAASGDPHAATAAAILNKPVTTVRRDERQRAKAVNFGFAFGMGPNKFVEYALANFGVSLTRDDALRMRTAFLAAYPGVARWQEKTRREMPLEVRSASGRRRIFASATSEYPERLNTPVQGTAADGMKQSMVLLHPGLRELGARIVLAVHDELVVEVATERAAEVRGLVTDAMVEGMARYVRSVPILVGASVRRNWADVV